ncbi:MAG: cytochrome c [Proteobacteria bacterium]|nr:cytochrome c [Pseudomonadota bacterium]
MVANSSRVTKGSSTTNKHRQYPLLRHVISLLLCVTMGGIIGLPPASGRTSVTEKKRDSYHLRKLLLEIDNIYHSSGSSEIKQTELLTVNTYLNKVLPKLTENKASQLTQLFHELKEKDALWDFRLKVIQAFEISPSPHSTLNYKLGQSLYQEYCASCHGNHGQGRGPLAQKLNQYQLNLTASRATLFPHLIYNLLLTGLDSGIMIPYERTLSTSDIWNIAFFTATLAEDCHSQRASLNVTHSSSESRWLAGYPLSLIHPRLFRRQQNNGNTSQDTSQIHEDQMMSFLRCYAPYEKKDTTVPSSQGDAK